MIHAMSSFVATHLPQIFVTTGLVVYSLAKNKLTIDGIIAAVVTAVVHMLHPWSVFFYLLVTFFMAGTLATKRTPGWYHRGIEFGYVAGPQLDSSVLHLVHHQQKALLTQSSMGGSGGEATHGRSASQVLANSLPASILILLDIYMGSNTEQSVGIFPIGIICSYAAATADTLSSELGILSSSSPFLITQPWRKVPRGTNGGVTVTGLLWGLFGGALIGLTSFLLLPVSPSERFLFVIAISQAGLFGSILDSVLGALFQATVEDKASGRVVEGENGKRVLVTKGGSRVQKGGLDWLNNNGVNFAMAMGTGLLGMAVAQAFTAKA